MLCREAAVERLRQKSIQQTTYNQYLHTLDVLGLSDVPIDDLSVQTVITKLGTVLNQGTRRKHIINLRATLGLDIQIPRPTQKIYSLPPFDGLVSACQGTHEMYGLVMLFAGLRLSEACVKQPLTGTTLTVDRQKRQDGTIAASKTQGPVVIPDWLADRYAGWHFNIGHSSLDMGIRRMFKRAGYRINAHQLRHAFATRLVATGASPEVLRRQLRHTNIETSLKFYVQTTDQDVTAAVARLGGTS